MSGVCLLQLLDAAPIFFLGLERLFLRGQLIESGNDGGLLRCGRFERAKLKLQLDLCRFLLYGSHLVDALRVQLVQRDAARVHFIRTIGQAQRANAGVRFGQTEILADTRAAMRPTSR